MSAPLILAAALGAGALYFLLGPKTEDKPAGGGGAPGGTGAPQGPRPPKKWLVLYGDDLGVPTEPGSYYIVKQRPTYLMGDYDAKVHVSKTGVIVAVVEDKGQTGVQVNDVAQLVYWDDKKKMWVESATSKPAIV